LHSIYNDWNIVLAAYSLGPTPVNKIIKRLDKHTFWEIHPYLPEETKGFVPAFMAMVYTHAKNNSNGIKVIPNTKFDTIQVDKKLHYQALKDVLSINIKELVFLNNPINNKIFPANYTAFIPSGTKEKYINLKDSIYFYQDSILLKPKTPVKPEIIIPKDGKPFIYRVKSGDVLGVIAERFNVRVSEIQNWNDLNGTRIDIGQKLTIYGKSSKAKVPKVTPKIKKQLIIEQPTTKNQPLDPKGYVTHTVKSGDNLWEIAKKYPGVSAQNIMDLNGIDNNLDIGQILKIKKK